MKISDLRKSLKCLSLPATGSKVELVERLDNYHRIKETEDNEETYEVNNNEADEVNKNVGMKVEDLNSKIETIILQPSNDGKMTKSKTKIRPKYWWLLKSTRQEWKANARS